MPAYACRTKAEALQNPEHMDIDKPSSTQAGGGPEVVLDSEALQNPEHISMDIDQAGGDLVVLLDSGAGDHMTGCGEVLQNREALEGQYVFGISGTPLPVTGQGSISGTRVLPICLDKVLYVPGLSKLLLVSVSQLTRALSARVIFEHDNCRVERISDNSQIGFGKRDGDLYKLERLTPVEIAPTGRIAGGSPNHDRSVFRPRNPPSYSSSLDASLTTYDQHRLVNVLTAHHSFVDRLYYIEASDIARLRDMASTTGQRSSRVQAVSAYLWKVLAAVVSWPRLACARSAAAWGGG